MEKLKHAFLQLNKFQIVLRKESLKISIFNHLKLKKVFLKQQLANLIKALRNCLVEP